MKVACSYFISEDFSISEGLEKDIWTLAEEIKVQTYWSGQEAPNERHFSVRLLWSEEAFYVRFEANQKEPLVISSQANLLSKTIGLWERDVCEIFIAPEKENPYKYFEFEIAPNGEWLDLEIYQKPSERITYWEYKSGMKSAAKIKEGKVLMGAKIPWQALRKGPKVGDIWLGNLFRCVGKGETRGFLAWLPTETPKPNFHVPEKFGFFEFKNQRII